MLFGAPVDEVAGVKGDAEKVGGDETELGGADADDANDGTVYTCLLYTSPSPRDS